MFGDEAGVDVTVEVRRNVSFPERPTTLFRLPAGTLHLLNVEVFAADCRTLGRGYDEVALLRFHPQLVHVL